MRIARPIFVAVVVALAPPAIANNTSPNSHANANAQAAEDAPASPGCHAYQKGHDGTWVEMACHEGIETAPPPVHGKSAGHHHDHTNQTTTR